MPLSRPNKDLGDDVIAQGVFVKFDDESGAYAEELPEDENFLEIIGDTRGETISGHGQVTYPEEVYEDGIRKNGKCGDYKSLYGNDLMHIRTKRFTCHLQMCPKCFRIWARRQAEKSAGYLWAFANYKCPLCGRKQDRNYKCAIHGVPYKPERKLQHWVLSPKNGENFDDWEKLDRKLRRVVHRFHRFENTVLAVTRHNMRKRCPNCGKKSEDSAFCDSCRVPFVWYWSPHLHIVSDFRYHKLLEKKFVRWEKTHRVIFTFIRNLFTQEQLVDLLAYEFGHARLILGKSLQVIRYLGFSNKTHFRSHTTRWHEEKSEKTPDQREHVFYKLQENSWEHVGGGKFRLRLSEGFWRWERNVFGELMPLTTTHFHVDLESLGQVTNGKFIRYRVPRKLAPLPVKEPNFTIASYIMFQNYVETTSE